MGQDTMEKDIVEYQWNGEGEKNLEETEPVSCWRADRALDEGEV